MPVCLRSRSIKPKAKQEEKSTSSNSPRRKTRKRSPSIEEMEYIEEPTRNIEEIRRKNLEDNKAFLEGLLLTKIRDDFKNLTNTLPTSIKRETKKRDYKYVTITENVPVRRSSRLARMDVSNKISSSDSSDDENNETKTENISRTYQRKVYKTTTTLSAEEEEELKEKIKTLFNQTNYTIESKKTTCDLSQMKIHDENVLKLTPQRLISIDIHVRSDILAITGCDKTGTVGLLVKSTDDLSGPNSKIEYNFHQAYATCCRFDNLNFNQINSTSFDSTFRTYDLTKHTSIEIFKEPNGIGLTNFDYHSSQTCLVSMDSGDVHLIDIRTNPRTIENFDLSRKRIRSLHINPTESNEFCVAGLDDFVAIWDLRNMSTMKYCLRTNRSTYGAYYNQIASHVMVGTRDDHLQSFSIDDMKNSNDPMNIEARKKIVHTNYVNRFVTPFTPQPFSMFESYFLIGSNRFPRTILVLDENCKTIETLSSENLNSLPTLQVSHRTLPIIVSGNSSGRIHIFTNHT